MLNWTMLNRNKIYLTQTDTTVGFLSNDFKKLNIIKNRSILKKVLIEVDSFKSLKKLTRIPKKYKKIIRNSKKTTFIYPNKKSYRVIFDKKHLNFLKKFNFLYSTSANITGKSYDESKAIKLADIIVYNDTFKENTPSKIYKITNQKIKKIRG